MKKRMVVAVVALASVVGLTARLKAGSESPAMGGIHDPTGQVATFTSTGTINMGSAFFQNLGSNGRTCATCHLQSDAWGVSAEHIRARFMATLGSDPIFRPVDGAVCPTADVSTLHAKAKAYSMLMNKGLIRVSMPVPENAEFKLIAVDDPYHCATADNLSLFRRPLPAANLRFLSAVMWDGRETAKDQSIESDLLSQAADATMGHAQGQRPTDTQLHDIVSFEIGLYTAQIRDHKAGSLTADGAGGGPEALAQQDYHAGINDVFGGDPTGAAFTPEAFTLYSAWKHAYSGDDDIDQSRRSVARGEELFNTFPIAIAGVGGINDALNQPVVMGTCTTCHDAPNAGNHSLSVPLNIGVVDESRRTPDMPLYTFQCTNGAIVKLTDPGRALISGKCSDLGKFKGPVLRGLAARAPYFHNGFAADLMDAVNFYDQRFNLQLNQQQKKDLVAFLKTL
jgi:cytochrome c peroxidase